MPRHIEVTVPEVEFVATTRAAFGLGAGLLLARRLDDRIRRRTGWALVALGVVTTVPILWRLLTSTDEA